MQQGICTEAEAHRSAPKCLFDTLATYRPERFRAPAPTYRDQELHGRNLGAEYTNTITESDGTETGFNLPLFTIKPASGSRRPRERTVELTISPPAAPGSPSET